MANEEHWKIFNQGPEAWNNWRKKNPDIAPDIQDHSFQGMNLKGYDLEGTGLVSISRKVNCWKCHTELDSSIHETCPRCERLICSNCGACFCGKKH